MQEWGGSDSRAAGQDATDSGREAGRQPESFAQEMGGRRPDWLPGKHLVPIHYLAVAVSSLHV